MRIVEALAANGAAVGVCGLEVYRVDETVAAVGAEGGQALAVPADVTDRSSVDRAVGATVERFGRLDVLVTSAGIQRYGDVVDTDEVTWDQVMAVNLKGVFLAAKAALPHLRKSGHGSVVVISSVQGHVAQTDVAAYAASKGALEMLVRSMAVDEAVHGVRVNAVCPGSVDTPMLRASARLQRWHRCRGAGARRAVGPVASCRPGGSSRRDRRGGCLPRERPGELRDRRGRPRRRGTAVHAGASPRPNDREAPTDGRHSRPPSRELSLVAPDVPRLAGLPTHGILGSVSEVVCKPSSDNTHA